MEKEKSIASQLEPNLKPLYQDLIKNVAHLDGEKCTFAVQWGNQYSLEVPRIVFVGRATNEWHGTEEDVNILFGDPKKKETIFNCYDQMTWVDRDAQSPVYATNGSAFWRVIRAVSRNYFPNDELNHVAWSNVCKIQYVNGKNPSGPLYNAQIETCQKIFKAEMDVLKPDFVIMFIGEFGKTDILSYMNGGQMPECVEIKKWDCYQAEVYKIGGTTYICTEHPMCKNESEHVKCIISLIENNKRGKRNEIREIIEKYRRMSGQERKYGAEKCSEYERIADYIEDNIDTYEDSSYETEEDVIDDVKESLAQVDDFYSEEDYENMDMLD